MVSMASGDNHMLPGPEPELGTLLQALGTLLLTSLSELAEDYGLYCQVRPCEAEAGAREIDGEEGVLLHQIRRKYHEQTRCVLRPEYLLLSCVVVPHRSARHDRVRCPALPSVRRATGAGMSSTANRGRG